VTPSGSWPKACTGENMGVFDGKTKVVDTMIPGLAGRDVAW
jgi:hypothetical protein